jgi:hypothetical protein
MSQTQAVPALPEIGHPEAWYAKRCHMADKYHDVHAHESYKVGQYVTLGMSPSMSWPEKLKYFQHALRRHCNPPPQPTEDVWLFYRKMAHLVKECCGREALRLCLEEDDLYAKRVALGQAREQIRGEARQFFGKFFPFDDSCPDWFIQEDFAQLKLIRKQWA